MPMKFQENLGTPVTELVVLKSLMNVVAAERQVASRCAFSQAEGETSYLV